MWLVTCTYVECVAFVRKSHPGTGRRSGSRAAKMLYMPTRSSNEAARQDQKEG